MSCAGPGVDAAGRAVDTGQRGVRTRPAWQLVARECALVVVVAAFQLAGTHAAARHQASTQSLDVGSTLLLLVGPLSLPLRHRAPWASIGLSLAAAVAYFSIGYPGGPVFASVVVALIWLYRNRIMQARVARRQDELRRRDEQRLQIAHELHDVLAHSTAVVSVQAGVALHLLDTHPERVRASLEAIRDASADTMRELRAALELLRPDSDVGQEPQPGLDRLDSLLASARAAGVTVVPATAGRPRPLHPEVDLAAYRIIQESLTNAARHAGPGDVRLLLTYGDDALVLQIDSPAGPDEPASAGAGRGLIGMRERAAALGGWTRPGPTDDGGFRVLAQLPYERSSR